MPLKQYYKQLNVSSWPNSPPGEMQLREETYILLNVVLQV